jgi:hypothetical protein
MSLASISKAISLSPAVINQTSNRSRGPGSIPGSTRFPEK